MARASWQGYITLGELGIPVRLYSATQSSQPRFVLLHETDGSPVERPYRCQKEGHDISYHETIRAVEVTPGTYVTLTDRELERTAVGPLKSIDIKQFAAPGAIASSYYDKPYYVTPSKGGERAYALLREVFARTNVIAVVQYILHAKEHIGALGIQGDLLMLHQLRFAAELLPRTSLKTPPLPKPSPPEIEALTRVVERFSGPFYIEDYHDEHAERLQELIDRKTKGLPAPRNRPTAPNATSEADILPTLQATLQSQRPVGIG